MVKGDVQVKITVERKRRSYFVCEANRSVGHLSERPGSERERDGECLAVESPEQK